MRLTGHGNYCWYVSTKVSADAMPAPESTGPITKRSKRIRPIQKAGWPFDFPTSRD